MPSDMWEFFYEYVEDCNNIIKYGDIRKLPRKFDWKHLCWYNDRWEVTEGVLHTRAEGNKYYIFDTEEQANEFIMLKMLEQ